MFGWLARYLGIDDPHAAARRRARLTEQEALAIAMKASEHVSDAFSLTFSAIVEDTDERVWVFSTTSRGSVWTVKIRDRDGRVIEKGRVGLR